MTVDAFLGWDPDDPHGHRWQLIDGTPVAIPLGGETHGAIQAELGALIGNHLFAQASLGRVILRPGIVPRVRSDRNYRVPDLAVTCAPPGKARIVPDPVLIVEILSPSSEHRTRANIWAYASIPSVREILAVHGTRQEAEKLRRDADGSWPAQPLPLKGSDTLTLEAIGFAIPLSAVYRTTALAAA
jgi:Uma2 family endonuclease